MLKPNTPAQSTAVFKRVTFSLTDQISEEIDRLSLALLDKVRRE